VLTGFLKMKRIAAVGGIALTLMGCLHQAHAICMLTGCLKGEVACEGKSTCVSCRGHCSKCSAKRCVHVAPSSDRAVTQSSPVGDCPTDGNCVCCQAQPVATPTLASDVSLTVVEAWMAEAPTNVVADIVESIDRHEGTGCVAPPLRAVDVCASLCRFLA
jgi:hypothetical protein